MKYTILCKLQCNTEKPGEELFAAGVDILEENGYDTKELFLRTFGDIITAHAWDEWKEWQQWYENRMRKERGENETQQSTCTGEEI
jgi:hypothetical protein